MKTDKLINYQLKTGQAGGMGVGNNSPPRGEAGKKSGKNLHD